MMVDLMWSLFWGWMAVAVTLAFVVVLMAVRLLVIQQMRLRFFVLFRVVGALFLTSILLAVSTI
jgi:hypothetical protein